MSCVYSPGRAASKDKSLARDRDTQCNDSEGGSRQSKRSKASMTSQPASSVDGAAASEAQAAVSASQATASASRPPRSRASRPPASNEQTEYMSATSAEGQPEPSGQHRTSGEAGQGRESMSTASQDDIMEAAHPGRTHGCVNDPAGMAPSPPQGLQLQQDGRSSQREGHITAQLLSEQASPPRRQPATSGTQQQPPTHQERSYGGLQHQLVNRLREVTIAATDGPAQQQPAEVLQPRAMQDGSAAVPDTAADSQHGTAGQSSSHQQPTLQQQAAASGMSVEFYSNVSGGNTSGSVRSHMTSVTETPQGLDADLTGYTLDQIR